MRGFPSSRYSIDEARCEVKLKGTDEEQIRQAYNKIQELLLKIDIVQISISKPLAKCVKESRKSALLIQTLQDVRNDDFEITDDKCVVWLVASSERENQIRKTNIENTIRGKLEELFVDQEEVPIQSSSLLVLKTDNWKKLTKTMLSKYVYIEEDTVGLQLLITTTKENFQDAKSQVTTFLGDTAMETVKLYIGRNAVSYLAEYPSDDVTGAKKIDFLKDVHGDLNGYVQISGTHSEIVDIQERLKDTQRNIKVVRFKISKPWLASATIMKIGNESSFEYDNKCILNMEIADYLAEEYVPCIAVLKESGCCIFVMQTDIRMSTCDVIVNCTDIKLQNKHGLSKALCEAAGDKVKNECTQYIQKNKHLELGKVFMSSPGKLQCHKIIHAACPRWNEKQEAKKELITSIVTNALTAADNEKMTSIILPAVGYVRGGKIPIKECAIEITNAVSNYMSQNKDSFLREIFLADLQQDKIDAFTEAVEKCFTTTPHFVFKHGRTLPKIEDIAQLSIKSTRFGKTMDATRFTKKHRRADDMRFHPNVMPQHQREQLLEDGNVTIHVGSDQGTKHDAFSSGLPFNIDISDTLTLHVETGAMESQNVDIIVNTTANFPHMGSAVSRALLRAGGNAIAQECKNKGDAEFKHGKVVRTSGGNLKCKHIYHTKIELGWKREGVEGIYNTVTKCLLSADKLRCRSISFPSIGTGGSNFPADKVANGMVKAVCDFTRDYPNSPVKDVHIVIFHADYATIKIFEQEIPVLLKPAGLADNLQPGTVIGGNKRAKPKFKYTNPGNHSAADDVVIVKAITTGDVKTLIKEFEKLVDDQYEKRSIDYGNELQNLSESEEILIKSLGKGHYMSLEIDQKKKEVKLSGLKENIHKVETNVRMMITNEIPQLREKHERGEQIARTVEWHYEDNGKQCPVSAPNNYEIHMNYLNGQDFEYKNILDGKMYKVLFATLEEHEVGQPNKKRRLYQKTKLSDDAIELPTLWTISTSDYATHREPLAPSDPEFIDVKTELRKANCPFKSIVNIIRIEDKYKWLQYETKKRQMEKQNPNSVTNERRLWHGTDSDTVDKIITGGYDRSFRGKNATMYGDGVYFAVEADYSHRYAIPDSQGVRRMFYNRVLTGEVCAGKQGMNVLPIKGTNNLGLNVLYDSAVDNMRTPVMYVIFHDTQAYPEYLIEYN